VKNPGLNDKRKKCFVIPLNRITGINRERAERGCTASLEEALKITDCTDQTTENTDYRLGRKYSCVYSYFISFVAYEISLFFT